MTQKILSVSGLGSTGSSAVVNLFEEITISKVAEGEFRFIQDPDGLEELCYLLSTSWGWVRSDAYIRRFIKYTDIIGRKFYPWKYGEGLNKQFNYNFFKERNKFLDEVISVTHKGHWFYHDYYERNFFQTLYYNLLRILSWWSPKKIFGREWLRKRSKLTDMYYVSPSNKIYSSANHFFSSLIKNYNNYDILIFDQLTLPYHFKRFQKIIPQLKQIVVDRDPRDVYLDAKDYNAYPITNNIYDFIRFYKDSRANKNIYQNTQSNLFIQFEDLIYNYEDTLIKIYDFVNIDSSKHKKKGKIFIPTKSKINTKTWLNEKNLIYKKDILIIEKELKEYLYDF